MFSPANTGAESFADVLPSSNLWKPFRRHVGVVGK
jgi:hypothetical protein